MTHIEAILSFIFGYLLALLWLPVKPAKAPMRDETILMRPLPPDWLWYYRELELAGTMDATHYEVVSMLMDSIDDLPPDQAARLRESYRAYLCGEEGPNARRVHEQFKARYNQS